MIVSGWRVALTPEEFSDPGSLVVLAGRSGEDWSGWLRKEGVLAGSPFLLSPEFEYDVGLNRFFLSHEMQGRAWETEPGYTVEFAGESGP